MQRGERNLVLILLAVLFIGTAYALTGRLKLGQNTVRITASRFEYNPPRIELRKGQPATLELVSADRIHGFHIPELGVRADVVPGLPVQIDLLPREAGTYPFLCDIFCGDGHGEMNGVVVVRE